MGLPSINPAQDDAQQELIKIFNQLRALDHPKYSLFEPMSKYRKELQRLKKKPIRDLQVIEKLLHSNLYTNRFWNYIEDVYTFLQSIIETNSPRKIIHTNAVAILTFFTRLMDKFMTERGYCCGKWFVLRSKPLNCSSKRKCSIKDKSIYFRYDHLTYCQKCFDLLPENNIECNNETITKSQFKRYVCELEKLEQFIQCYRCKKEFHERCVLHSNTQFCEFYCDACRALPGVNIKVPVLRASHITSTECDQYIIQFLTNNLKVDRNLTIRLVSSRKIAFTLSKEIARYLEDPRKIFYNNCNLLAFFEDETGHDVCFFTVFFQLYGTRCPEPNKTTVYISYIDSVNLIPSEYRTKIYRLILLGLFDFLRTKGYTKIVIWACPPKPGNDYVFNRKPPDMKIPTSQLLANWYKELCETAVTFGIIESFCGSEKFATDHNWKEIKNIPFFDGDLWIVRLQEAIAAAETKVLKAHPSTFNVREKIWELMKVQVTGFNSFYFILEYRKHDVPQAPIYMQIIEHEWNNRHALVDFFCEFKLQFSSLRQTRFSTHMLLVYLLKESLICIICNKIKLVIDDSFCCRRCVLKQLAPKPVDLTLMELDFSNKENVNAGAGPSNGNLSRNHSNRQISVDLTGPSPKRLKINDLTYGESSLNIRKLN